MPLMLPVPIRLILGAGHVSNYKMNQCVIPHEDVPAALLALTT